MRKSDECDKEVALRGDAESSGIKMPTEVYLWVQNKLENFLSFAAEKKIFGSSCIQD